MTAMRGTWLDCFTVLVALSMLAALQGTNATCAVRLDLDELNSTLVLTSANSLKRSSGFPLTSNPTFNKTAPRGLSGVLYAVSQTLSACPAASDRASWLANWPSFTLTSVPLSTTHNQAIAVYPAMHLGKNLLPGNYTYNYNLTDLQLAVTIRSTAASTGQSGAFTADVATQLADGWLASYSTLTGLRVDNLQNLTANVSAVSTSVDVQVVNGSSTLVLEIPSLSLTYMSIGRVTLGSTVWDSFANNTLTSRLRATAVLNCPTYCGDYGRCQVTNGTALCVCECGWSKDDNGQCNMPWGFCDASSGNVVVMLQEVAAPSTPSTPSTPSGVQPSNGTCPSGFDWDPSGTSCTACPSGFSGHDCAMCATSAACQTKLSSSTAQCVLSPLYQPTTTVKNYECDVLDPSVASIVGTSLDFTCSTRPPATGASVDGLSVAGGLVAQGSPVNATPYCTLSFRLAGMPRDAAVVCTGWGCEFATSSSRVYCPLVQCKCPKGCASADGAITEATFTNLNTNIQLACGAEARKAATTADGVSSCSIELSGLPLAPIPLSCTTAECSDPVNGTVNVGAASTEAESSPVVAPVIAFVPSMVLLLAALLTAAAVVYFEHLVGPRRRIGRDGAAGAGAGAASAVKPAPAAPAQPVGEAAEADAPRSGTGRDGDESWGPLPLRSGDADGAAQALPPLSPGQPQPQQQQQPAQQPPQPRPSLPGQLATPSPQGTPQPGTSASDRAPSGSSSTDRGYGQGSSSPDGSGGVVAGVVVKGVAEGTYPAAAAADAVPAADHWAVVTEDGSEQQTVQVLSWHGLDLTTRPRRSALPPWRPQAPTALLRNVSGKAVRGQLLGILGPSGSGKTTLLGVLAGLIQPGMHWRLGGCVRVDGRAVGSPRHLAALVGHVPQHDCLCRSLTVAECVAASAALRLSWRDLRRGRQHVQARVASVLRQLGISHLANRVVWPGGGSTLSAGGGGGGDAATTLSSGERLRVAASLELVYDPPVLLLDEPLSGLDSATAKSMMALIRSVATGDGGAGRRVVVASLHQPSPALFATLDGVLLMSAGRVAAAGPPGGLAALLAAAALPPPPPDVHIAEHLLDIVVSRPDQAAQLCDWHERNGGAAAEPPLASSATISATTTTATTGGGGGGGGRGPVDDRVYIEGLVAARGGGSGLAVALRRLCLELGAVAWRSGLDMLRNPALAALHWVVTGALGLLVGAVFSDTDLNVSGAQNRVGAIFFSVMLLACFATSAVDGLYPERGTVDRDLLRRSYGVVPYMLAKLVLDGVLLRAFPACAFALPFYWLMGLRHQAAAFLTFLGAFITMSGLSGAACIALCSVFSSPGRAVLVLNLLLLTCALFSGFLANKASIVVWLRWIVYLSPIRFCWEALVINELKPLVLTFSSPDLPQGLPAVKGSLFLSLLGVDPNLLHTDLIVLGCMYGILALLALAFAALRLAAIRGRWT